MAITVLPVDHGATPPCPSMLQEAFTVLDERHLPATWAIAHTGSDLRLAQSLLAGRVVHELAFVLRGGDIGNEAAGFPRFSHIAERVELPLRSLVAAASGVHPSLLTQWGVEAFVPLGSDYPPSRTGLPRALTWGVWEIPVTDRLATPGDNIEVAQLERRIHHTVRESTRLHLLWQLSPQSNGRLSDDVVHMLDLVAEYHGRGWLAMETAGSAAAEVSRLATPRLAA
ncbi:hypothetical protein NG895_27765 [Aeoliella sp. ICT_H6.2]|uniref:Uncharacterized protein n=1 Tax=Aeoliella straminimaris TaxID=2954799 RepID=A0A9X2FID5_9BACT|nr:hypothetical protein [Aeoliella straminimaris]MCO6047719.1 hypothetical protein [Aeoliella straminimaris]